MSPLKPSRTRTEEDRVTQLQHQLDETQARFDALVAGQLDSVTAPLGPVLLKEAQRALHRSELTFRALIEHLPDQVWVHRDGVVLYVNPNTVSSLGYQRADELIGLPALRFVHEADRVAMAEHRASMPPLGESRAPYQMRLLHRDGHAMTVEVTANGVSFDGQRATLEVTRDITEQKRLEAHVLVSDRLASIGMLAAGIAHEINNPLSFVMANLDFVAIKLEALQAGRVSERVDLGELLEVISEAHTGAVRIKDIVTEVRCFSPTDTGARTAVDINRMLDAMLGMVGNEIRHRARLVKAYAPGAALMVEGNESQLGQVFLNLLLNAAQAIPDGAADANEVRLTTSLLDDGRVVVEIRDTGGGISPEVRAQLFTPFFTTKPKGHGTGLGLSICHKIVTAHGGRIEVESAVGTGTVFRVILPPAPVKAALEVPTSAAQPAEVTAERRGRVMVIDDEPLVSRALARLVVSHHEVVVFNSGAAALEHLASDSNFDVIFCDLMMPELTGPQFYERLLRSQPQLAQRVVFVTGGAFAPTVKAFVAQTSNLVLHKPFAASQILAAVARLLRPVG